MGNERPLFALFRLGTAADGFSTSLSPHCYSRHVLALSALLLSAAAPQAGEAALGRVWPGLAAERVRACGLPNVTLAYQRDLDAYVVVVSGAQSASDDRLRCAAKVSLETDYTIIFPAMLSQRYDQVYWPMADAMSRQAARAWLAKRGLKLPVYAKGSDQLGYARKLERMCGPRAGGAFVIEEGFVTLSSGNSRLDAATFDCLANALSASGLPSGIAGH